jgi:ABC-2 type transport system ATP-binding protein
MKRYGETVALDDVRLDIPIGQTIALLGPNGAGKSTAINLMLGLLDPTEGSVRSLGLDPRDAVAGGRIGAMLQISGLPMMARVGELVAFVRRIYPEALPQDVVLARAGMTDLEARLVETLSGGEAQRLHFALAIAGDPDLVFLDEPTVGMDVETRRAFWTDMRAFAADGRTVVFATHYLDEADNVADRIVVLDKGRIVADGTSRSIKATVSTRTVRFNLPGLTLDTLEAIRAMPVVTAVEILADRVSVTTSDSDAVVQALFAREIPISDLEIAGAGLEDAFLALTNTDR